MNEIFLNEDDAESSKNSSKYVGDYWLKAGIYVRSKTDYDNNIKRGAVLLITDIERVDGKDHTVNILAHPEWETRRTYSFVANEFMQLFSYAADGEKVRAIELQKSKAK